MNKQIERVASHLANLRLALSFVWESTPGLTIANTFLLVVQGIIPLAMLLLIKLIVDTATLSMDQTNIGSLIEETFLLILAMGGVALLGAMSSTAFTYVSLIQSQIVTDHMHAILHAKSIAVDLEYYENSRYYDTLHRAQQEAFHRPTAILMSLLKVGENSIALLALGGLLLLFQWWVIVILILTALPDFLIRLRHSKQLYHWRRKRTPVERSAWYLDWILTRDTHAKEVRLFDLGLRFRQWFQDLRQTLRRERQNLEQRLLWATLGSQAIGTVGVFGVYFFVAYRTLHGQLTIGELVMYFQAMQRATGFLKRLGNSLSNLYANNLFLNNVEEFLNIKSNIVDPAVPKSIPKPAKIGLKFDHVTFQYPSQNFPALKNLSLVIHPGEHIALVGANGAGKTTLVKLLCRLYDPNNGRITLDGIDIQEFSLSDLRLEVSAVFQDFARYHMTANNNIGLGVKPDQLQQSRIISAAQQAGVDEVITQLPKGYDTMLGKWFEDGHELSIGEWQKLALARAFLRDSQILIMDEPTSAMDPQAEAETFERFHHLAKDRMAILISHRLSTVKMVDRIYLLDKGCIVESGTHDELVNLKGQYTEMFETQAQRYR